MNVEHENFFFSIFASVQRCGGGGSGTSFVIAWAKSALMTSASARCSPASVRTPDRLAALEQHLLHLLAERECRRPVRAATRAIAVGHRAAAADRVPDAVLVFEERQDREQARAVERRHAEVLRLERERQPDARVAEVPAQFAVERRPRPQQSAAASAAASGCRSRQLEERPLQARAELFELVPVLGRGSGGRSRASAGLMLRDLGFHARDVGRAVELPAAAEHDAVLRVEPDHRDFGLQVAADSSKMRSSTRG